MARFGAEWIYISELETLGQVKIGNQENFWIADASDAEWIYTYPQSWKLWVKSRWREAQKLETKKQVCIADASGSHVHLL